MVRVISQFSSLFSIAFASRPRTDVSSISLLLCGISPGQLSPGLIDHPSLRKKDQIDTSSTDLPFVSFNLNKFENMFTKHRFVE